MTVTRQNILRGPAIVQMGGQSFYTEGDIKVALMLETFGIPSSVYGNTGERMKDVSIKISFTPVGMWDEDLLAIMYGQFTNPSIGASLFGSSDAPVTIHPTNGKEKIVFSAGAITGIPAVNLFAAETSFKQMEITCLLKNGSDRAAADALFTLTAEAVFNDATFDVGTILTVPYSIAFSGASSPWDSVELEAGAEISFDLKTSPVTLANQGVVDMTLSSLGISVKMKPVGITVAQLLAQLKIQGTGVARGMNISASVNNLTISGGSGNPQVVVNNVRLKTAPQIYGAEALRIDTLEWVATRPTGGAMFSIGLAS